MSDRPAYYICMRTDWAPPAINLTLATDTCTLCGEPVWINPDMLARTREQAGVPMVVVCSVCAPQYNPDEVLESLKILMEMLRDDHSASEGN